MSDSGDGERPQEVVSGTLVLYRVPGADGKPRWDIAQADFESTVRLGRYLAILIGPHGQYQLWSSSPVDPSIRGITVTHNGWFVRTANSRYLVEVLNEGSTRRAVRRETGAMPILDPDVSARVYLRENQPVGGRGAIVDEDAGTKDPD